MTFQDTKKHLNSHLRSWSWGTTIRGGFRLLKTNWSPTCWRFRLLGFCWCQKVASMPATKRVGGYGVLGTECWYWYQHLDFPRRVSMVSQENKRWSSKSLINDLHRPWHMLGMVDYGWLYNDGWLWFINLDSTAPALKLPMIRFRVPSKHDHVLWCHIVQSWFSFVVALYDSWLWLSLSMSIFDQPSSCLTNNYSWPQPQPWKQIPTTRLLILFHVIGDGWWWSMVD